MFIFDLPGRVDNAAKWLEWTSTIPVGVILTTAIGFIVAGLLLWFIEWGWARFKGQFLPSGRQRKLQALFPLFEKALSLENEIHEAASVGKDAIAYNLVNSLLAQYKVIGAKLNELGIHVVFSDVQYWDFVIREAAPFVEQGMYEQVQAICDQHMSIEKEWATIHSGGN